MSWLALKRWAGHEMLVCSSAMLKLQVMFQCFIVWWHVHMLLAPLCQGEMPLPSRGWGGEDIACGECAIGRECTASTKQWRGLSHSQATSVAKSTSPIYKSHNVGHLCTLCRDHELEEYGWRMSTCAPSPASTLPRITGIQREVCQQVQISDVGWHVEGSVAVLAACTGCPAAASCSPPCLRWVDSAWSTRGHLSDNSVRRSYRHCHPPWLAPMHQMHCSSCRGVQGHNLGNPRWVLWHLNATGMPLGWCGGAWSKSG